MNRQSFSNFSLSHSNDTRFYSSMPNYIMESALALKRGRNEFDYVVFVYASESVRLERAMKRDSVSEDKIRQRMESQEFDLSLIDFTINNEIDFHESADECVEELCIQL